MPRKPLNLRFAVIATLLGNTLEWYDAATFGFLIPVFTKLFFPETENWIATLHLTLIFVLGAITRPLGGIIFGFIGDRYGRKNALIASVLLMTFPTLIIALLPSYLQIGVAATIILSVMRLLQGVAAGGEFPGVVTFLTESSRPTKRGLYGSFAYFGVTLGVFLGGLDFLFLNIHYSPEAFFTWGWRSIYFLGAIIGGIAFFLRRRLHETPPFQEIRESHEILKDPLLCLLSEHKKKLAKLMGIEILETFGFNLIISFSIIYFSNILHLSFSQAIRLNLLCLFFLLIAIPFAGWLADKIGIKKMATLGAWGFLLFSFPLYWISQFASFQIITATGFGLLLASYMAAMPAIYSSLFPAKTRFSGIGIGYNFTVALTGGCSPMVAYVLIRYTGQHFVPAFFLMAGAVISLLTLRTIHLKKATV